jgi:hypothetical protein
MSAHILRTPALQARRGIDATARFTYPAGKGFPSMTRLIRRVASLLAFLMLIAAGALFAVDAVAKAAIERGGSAAFGVETKLESADIGLLGGGIGLAGLEIANPAGYRGPHSITIRSIDSEGSLTKLLDSPVEIPKLAISGIRANIERRDAQTNWGVLAENVKRLESGESKEGKRFIIREMIISDVVVTVDVAGAALPAGPLGQLGQLELKIDSLRLADVGAEGNQGVVLAEVAGVLLKALLNGVAEKGAGVLPAELTRDFEQRLQGLAGLGDGLKLLDVKGSGGENIQRALDALKGRR